MKIYLVVMFILPMIGVGVAIAKHGEERQYNGLTTLIDMLLYLPVFYWAYLWLWMGK